LTKLKINAEVLTRVIKQHNLKVL